MNMKEWEKKMAAEPGASERDGAIQREVITAAELERMTPNERAAAVNARIVTDLDSVSPEFRSRVETTALRLADGRRRDEGLT